MAELSFTRSSMMITSGMRNTRIWCKVRGLPKILNQIGLSISADRHYLYYLRVRILVILVFKPLEHHEVYLRNWPRVGFEEVMDKSRLAKVKVCVSFDHRFLLEFSLVCGGFNMMNRIIANVLRLSILNTVNIRGLKFGPKVMGPFLCSLDQRRVSQARWFISTLTKIERHSSGGQFHQREATKKRVSIWYY